MLYYRLVQYTQKALSTLFCILKLKDASHWLVLHDWQGKDSILCVSLRDHSQCCSLGFWPQVAEESSGFEPTISHQYTWFRLRPFNRSSNNRASHDSNHRFVLMCTLKYIIVFIITTIHIPEPELYIRSDLHDNMVTYGPAMNHAI